MEGDTILTQADAETIHSDGYTRGYMVMWTVTWNTSDYPRKAAVRPRYIDRHVHMLPAVLLADSLDEVRAQLPRGLMRLERTPYDDARIVEVWV